MQKERKEENKTKREAERGEVKKINLFSMHSFYL
jgi:hypothetical protein